MCTKNTYKPDSWMAQLLTSVTEGSSTLPLRVGMLCGNQQDEMESAYTKSHAMLVIRKNDI